MNKKEILATHKKLLELSVNHLEGLKKRNLSQQELVDEMSIIEPVLADRLFTMTGIDSDDLDIATEQLKLEEDAEFQMMIAEYSQKVTAINLMNQQ
jgi:hypothetical protein